jgi:hypothetical protein
MQRFDWQTEEEGAARPVYTPAPVSRRTGLVAAAIIASVLVVAVVVVWQIGRQEVIHDREVRDDVNATFGVWRRAVATKDSDLLDTLLLGGEASWTATERELLESGRMLDRSGAGLGLVEDHGQALDVEAHVEIAKDWRSAEITFPVSYSRPEDNGLQTVQLEQTVPLVREGSRWLLRRPGEEFWGLWRTSGGRLAELTFRERDAAFAGRFLEDLDRDLSQVCARAANGNGCPAETNVNVRLESDPAALFREIDPESPAFIGRTFVLPSPTLVGNPLDEASYQALYALYSGPILKTFVGTINTPIRWPEQVVEMICLERNGILPHLFRYDPAGDTWMSELESSAFQFLTASDDDARIALRQYMPSEPYRLRVVLWAAGQATVVHDETYGPLADHTLGWIDSAGQTELLLSEFQGTTREPSYYATTGITSTDADCSASGCPLRQLDGFPRWSSDGQHSLVQIDQNVYLADAAGQAEVDLGQGHDAFWLDDSLYGFVRSLSGEGRPVEEVVAGAIDNSGLSVLWNTAAATPELIAAPADSPFFVQHVATSGNTALRLLLYGRQYAGDDSRYVVLSLPLQSDENAVGQVSLAGPVGVEVSLDQSPASFPSPEGPNGHVPFIVSPDGRWLTVAHLAAKGADEWIIDVIEIGRGNRLSYKTSYPGYSFNFPFLDWSSDGRWLLIVDHEFIRIVAPASGYERIVAHDKGNCSYAAWLNRQAGD